MNGTARVLVVVTARDNGIVLTRVRVLVDDGTTIVVIESTVVLPVMIMDVTVLIRVDIPVVVVVEKTVVTVNVKMFVVDVNKRALVVVVDDTTGTVEVTVVKSKSVVVVDRVVTEVTVSPDKIGGGGVDVQATRNKFEQSR